MAVALDVSKTGAFERKDSSFRKFVTADGLKDGFKAEAGRYHLYASYAWPWAHRTVIVRALKGLTKAIDLTYVDSKLVMGQGWNFHPDRPDPIHGFHHVSEVYGLDKNYNGRFTVPILFDKKTNTIVNNESSDIIQFLNSEFNAFCETPEQAALDLYPSSLRSGIDEINDFIYHSINNGVYKCGFAKSQEAYDSAFAALFSALDRVEGILAKSRYLVGESLTLADIRLFTTLIRFEPVYFGHFKCNGGHLPVNYPNLWGFTRDMYQREVIKPTVLIDEIKLHYYWSHTGVNPTQVVPQGPTHYQRDLDAPHQRNQHKK